MSAQAAIEVSFDVKDKTCIGCDIVVESRSTLSRLPNEIRSMVFDGLDNGNSVELDVVSQLCLALTSRRLAKIAARAKIILPTRISADSTGIRYLETIATRRDEREPSRDLPPQHQHGITSDADAATAGLDAKGVGVLLICGTWAEM